jgi:hypothetical protein
MSVLKTWYLSDEGGAIVTKATVYLPRVRRFFSERVRQYMEEESGEIR